MHAYVCIENALFLCALTSTLERVFRSCESVGGMAGLSRYHRPLLDP